MTKRRIRDTAASVHQRLLNRAKATDRPFGEVLQYWAIERFLYRLSVSEHAGKFVLKGALMLPVWSTGLSRPTMDIDLLGRTANRVDVIAQVVRDVCRVDVAPDGLSFDAEGVEAEAIAAQAEYEGVRVRFAGLLGSARVSMQIDVGFGDVVVPSTERVNYPTILEMPAPQLEGYSKESFVAEKFEAMVRFGELNSRMKDFHDVWAVAQRLDFDGATLSEAIKATFANRGTRIPADPEPLRPSFARGAAKETQWRGFVRRHRLERHPRGFAEVVTELALFLLPVAKEVSAGGVWRRMWRAPGPWSSPE